MACPLLPLMSLSTLASCTFICVSAFCICCTAREASSTCRPRNRHIARTPCMSSAS